MLKLIGHMKNKKGSMAIEIIIGCMMFLLVMCFFLDITTLTWKLSVISQANTYIARTVGIQGGVKPSAPTGFPGGNTAYESSTEILDKVKQSFNNAKIADTEYQIYINNTLLKGSTNIETDYESMLTTKIIVNYKWDMLSNFIPGSLSHSIVSNRAVMSEFKYRYDSWIGE